MTLMRYKSNLLTVFAVKKRVAHPRGGAPLLSVLIPRELGAWSSEECSLDRGAARHRLVGVDELPPAVLASDNAGVHGKGS